MLIGTFRQYEKEESNSLIQSVRWLHGGGYMAGRAHQYRGPAAELSARMGAIPVIIPDYRLVPEADFATEVVGDCVEAYKWAVER